MIDPTTRDRWLRRLLLTLAAISATLVVWIAVFLVAESLPLLKNGPLRFFTDAAWRPDAGQYRLTAMLAGTLAVTAGAVALAAPLGLLAALFCRHYAPPWLGDAFRRLLELLAGVPSVVYGFWGLVTLVPLIARWQPPGAGLLAAVLVLALMILPLVALAADAGLAQVPRPQWQAAMALGLTRWAAIRRVALPAAGPAIAAGVILQTGRALGETMAVLMVAGNVVQTPAGLFEPVRTLTANIALEMAYATGDHRTALFVSGLLLLLTAGLLVLASIGVERRRPSYVA